VLAHGLSAELGVEGGDALEAGGRDVGPLGDPPQRRLRQVAVRLLDGLEQGDGGLLAAADPPDRLVNGLQVDVVHVSVLPLTMSF